MNTPWKSSRSKYGMLLIALLGIACLAGIAAHAVSVGRRQSALVDAISQHDFGGVQRQLESGIDPNFYIYPPRDYSFRRLFSHMVCGPLPIRNTPLILAATEGDDRIVQRLLSYGADINAQERYMKTTALLAAIYAKHESTAELLFQNHADPNIGDFNHYTATITAVQSGKPAMLKLVFEHHAFTMAKDVDGMNALDWAKYCKNQNMIRLVEKYARQAE